MPANITIKNIPDPLHERLKQSAELNHRSINSEVIALLERALFPIRMGHEERLARANVLRQDIAPYVVTPEDIEAAIEEGRP